MKQLNGVYLVIDPSIDWDVLLEKLRLALEGGTHIVQIWNHWNADVNTIKKTELISKVKTLALQFQVPVLMHEDWQLAQETGLDGVHFDVIPENYDQVEMTLRGKYIGLTVGNDLDTIMWAERQKISYISFCAMFPSSSVTSCEIVMPETIIKAREVTSLPIFLSGGIRPENLKDLRSLSFAGVAIISGILNQKNPKSAVRQYLNELNSIHS